MTSAIIVFIFYLLIIVTMGIGCIYTIIAIWKMAKAHESLAETMKIIAQNMKPKQEQ
ncbi:MAG: hypothetical protein ACYDEJ_02305 [Desulfitobacteriaceae bacterium]